MPRLGTSKDKRPPTTWIAAQHRRRRFNGRAPLYKGGLPPHRYQRVTDQHSDNAHELAFIKLARSQGWHVTKSGWPDFFCVTPEGQVVLVEVKPASRPTPTKHQQAVLSLLAKLGLDVRISYGDDLGKPYRPAVSKVKV